MNRLYNKRQKVNDCKRYYSTKSMKSRFIIWHKKNLQTLRVQQSYLYVRQRITYGFCNRGWTRECGNTYHNGIWEEANSLFSVWNCIIEVENLKWETRSDSLIVKRWHSLGVECHQLRSFALKLKNEERITVLCESERVSYECLQLERHHAHSKIIFILAWVRIEVIVRVITLF